jgi:hypothetical protein
MPAPGMEISCGGEPITARDLCGALWNCDDILSGSYKADLLDHGYTGKRWTIAAVARWLRSTMSETAAVA